MKGFGEKQNKKVKAIKIDLFDLPNLKSQALNYLNNGNWKQADKIYIQCLREGVTDEELLKDIVHEILEIPPKDQQS